MRINCPSCNHNSEVPDHLIGDNGRDLRCPSCASSFTVLPGGWTTQIGPAETPSNSQEDETGPAANAGNRRDGPYLSLGNSSDSISSDSSGSTSHPSGQSASRSSSERGSRGEAEPPSPRQPRSRQMPELQRGTELDERYQIESTIG